MKKRIPILILFFLSSVWAVAQDFGGFFGRVTDAEKNPLPGVAVTLTSAKIAPQYTVTSSEGRFRFTGLPPAADYSLQCDSPGFKTLLWERLTVAYGENVRLEFELHPLPPDELISVSGSTPSIDKNSRRTGLTLTGNAIMSLPTARDPWVLLALAPGLVVDREDVGGSESGLQSYVYGQGSTLTDIVWTIDGADITDPSVLGDAPAYLNPAIYEEMRVDYAGGDVRARTGGIHLNLVTKRGGNGFSGTAYFDASGKAFELNNIPLALQSSGYGSPGVNSVRLYGANLGGPVLRDRIWAAGAWGVQDIDRRTLTGLSDAAKIVSGYFNLDIKLSSSACFNGFFEIDEKRSLNRSAWSDTEQAPETLWNQTGPSLMGKAVVEKKFGNLSLAVKAMFSKLDFHLEPVNGPRTEDGSGPYMVQSYNPSFRVTGNTDDYRRKRNQFDLALTGRIFLDNILGGGHEITFGAESRTASASLADTYESNLILYDYGPGWIEANLLRDSLASYGYNRFSAHFQDTIEWGRFSLSLGLRFDRERSLVRDQIVPASPWLSEFLPSLAVAEYDPGAAWSVLSPRIGLSYDIRGDGRDVIKLSLAVYGSPSGLEPAAFVNSPAAGIGLLWKDADRNGRVAAGELWGFDWRSGELKSPGNSAFWLYYWGFDPTDPTRFSPVNQYAPTSAPALLDEVLLSYEKEMSADFAARIEILYRKRHRLAVDRGIFADGALETSDNWVLYGRDSLLDRDFWARKETPVGVYRESSDKRFEQYVSASLVLSKRLAHGWMLNGSVTVSDWKSYYGGDYLDPTNIDYFDGGPVAPESSGSGLRGVFVNSRWTAKLSGLARLPLGVNFSAAVQAREGFIVPTYTIVNRPGIGPTFLYGRAGGGGKFGDTRLPSLFLLNARLEKSISIGDRATATVAVDGFNVLNSATSLKRAGLIGASDFLQDKTILDPALFRLSLRFTF